MKVACGFEMLANDLHLRDMLEDHANRTVEVGGYCLNPRLLLENVLTIPLYVRPTILTQTRVGGASRRG
jgi:hypothetical protein